MPHGSVNIPSPDVPLDQEAYEKYCRCIDYALFFNRPSAYELRASGAILDAFSFLKPIIALKSPLSEYYFKKMGDIGYLCENYNAVRDTVLDILEDKAYRSLSSTTREHTDTKSPVLSGRPFAEVSQFVKKHNRLNQIAGMSRPSGYFRGEFQHHPHREASPSLSRNKIPVSFQTQPSAVLFRVQFSAI